MYPIQDETVKTGQLFDDQFISELKRFFSHGNRRTRRSSILARILLETAIETGNEVYIIDHYLFSNLNFDIVKRRLEHEIMAVYSWYREQGVSFSKISVRNNKVYAVLYNDGKSHALYHSLRIKEIEHKSIKKEKEFSKLLLIL